MNDYNTESETIESADSKLFMPFALLAGALLLILLWQMYISVSVTNGLLNAINQSKAPVQQAQQVKSKLESIVLDLMELSKTDANAKAIVDKYQIRKNTP